MKRILTLALTFTMSLGAIAAARETGVAVVYADKYNGRKTTSGEIYDAGKLSAAHKTLPFGTTVRVTNLKNHRSVVLRITDRGPRQKARILDLSPAAAARLGINRHGVGKVRLDVVTLGSGKIGRQAAR